MTLDPTALGDQLDLLEAVEKATLRLVVQAIHDFNLREHADDIFAHEPDLVQDIAEDVTREALDRLGASVIPVRLFGKYGLQAGAVRIPGGLLPASSALCRFES